MNYEEYKKAYFTDPAPESRYRFSGAVSITLFFQTYDAAAEYYETVLGQPAYVEGAGTKGWKLGQVWLTLLHGKSGNPQNVEVTIHLDSPEEAERLQQAFIDAGGTGASPSDELMYEPIRYCPVQDPFGTDLLIIAPLAS